MSQQQVPTVYRPIVAAISGERAQKMREERRLLLNYRKACALRKAGAS